MTIKELRVIKTKYATLREMKRDNPVGWRKVLSGNAWIRDVEGGILLTERKWINNPKGSKGHEQGIKIPAILRRIGKERALARRKVKEIDPGRPPRMCPCCWDKGYQIRLIPYYKQGTSKHEAPANLILLYCRICGEVYNYYKGVRRTMIIRVEDEELIKAFKQC
jgi:hypothetical protein